MAVAGNSLARRRAWPACGCRSKATCCRPSSPKALKPLIPGVITFGAGHFYISQSDKGGLVFGGDIDGYNSYAQRGNLPAVEDVCEGGMALMPMIGRARLLRSWGGIMDMSMDGSPIIDRTPVDGLYLNAGWCYGGFKATPASGWCFAHLLATDEPHETASGLSARPLRDRPSDRRKGPGRPTQPALRAGTMRIPCPYCGERDAQRIRLSRRCRRRVRARRCGRRLLRLRLSARQSARARCASTGITPRAAAPGWWSTRDTAHPRDHPDAALARGRTRDDAVSSTGGLIDRGTAARLHLRRQALSRALPATRWPRRCSPTASGWSAARSSITARAAS